MQRTPLTTAIVAQKLLTLLAGYWQPREQWWAKCASTYELYLSHIACARDRSGLLVVACATCDISFPLDARARKNRYFCIFGCREENRRKKNLENKKRQRKRDRNRKSAISVEGTITLCNHKPPISSTPPSNPLDISIGLIERLDSLDLTDLVTTTVLLVSATHLAVGNDLAKLCGIVAFMSAGMKFAHRMPEWMAGFSENVLREVIDEIEDG